MKGEDKATYFYDVLMLQLAQEFDLPNGGHVQAILELADLDLLDSYFSPGG